METDDELRRSMAQCLKDERFGVSEATATGEAVAHLMERDTEIIPMSERMSMIDPLALLPLLRRMSPAPMIVIGARGNAAVAQGAIGYLDRPPDLRELLDQAFDLLLRLCGRDSF